MRSRDNISLKTTGEILRVKQITNRLRTFLNQLASHIKPGITTKQIDEMYTQYMKTWHLQSAQIDGPQFPAHACISTNSVAVHGIPNDVALQHGDVVTVDVSAMYDSWHGDIAWTYIVGNHSAQTRRLIRAAWQASLAGIAVCESGTPLCAIGNAITAKAHQYGCKVLSEFTGHGIGTLLHEDPVIYHVQNSSDTIRITPGMILNIEPVITLGDDNASLLNDGWSYTTADGTLCAQFEHTVAIFKDHYLPLSLSLKELELELPPFF